MNDPDNHIHWFEEPGINDIPLVGDKRASQREMYRDYRADLPRHARSRRIVQGVSTIAAAFWPKPVVVRMSDFKSNKYVETGIDSISLNPGAVLKTTQQVLEIEARQTPTRP